MPGSGRPRLDRAVEGVLELLEHGDLVATRVHEHGAVLGRRDVPLQALEHQRVAYLVASGDDVRVRLVHADPGVGGAAVIGDDQPVQTVGVGVLDLVDHPVNAVRAGLGVNVVVAGQPAVAAGVRPMGTSIVIGVVAVVVGVRDSAADHAARGGAGAEQSGVAQDDVVCCWGIGAQQSGRQPI